MNNKEIRSLFIAFNAAIFILVLCIFSANSNYLNNKKEQLCFKYAIKKCNFKDKSKALTICNTLVRHNREILSIKNHRQCRKDL